MSMFFLAPMVAVVAFPLCMDVVEVMVVRMGTEGGMSIEHAHRFNVFFGRLLLPCLVLYIVYNFDLEIISLFYVC